VPRSLLAHLSLFRRLLRSRFTGAKVPETGRENGGSRRWERDRRAMLLRETLQEVAGPAAGDPVTCASPPSLASSGSRDRARAAVQLGDEIVHTGPGRAASARSSGPAGFELLNRHPCCSTQV